MTDVLRPTPVGIAAAATLLAEGAIVAFPTDTVHGLACRADDAAALERLFALKGRPPERRIAWLVADMDQAVGIGIGDDPRARRLADALWPGGLTVVLRFGDGSLGVRSPAHPVTRDLLALTGPLPATSANPHGFPECRSTDDVLIAFAGADDLAAVVDGESPGGVASTVLDLSAESPRILRAGVVSRERLEDLLGPID